MNPLILKQVSKILIQLLIDHKIPRQDLLTYLQMTQQKLVIGRSESV